MIDAALGDRFMEAFKEYVYSKDSTTASTMDKLQKLGDQPGAICVVSGDRTTYPEFAVHLYAVKIPDGTRLHWARCGGGAIAMMRNQLVDAALAHGARWIWFIDDDHVFPPHILMTLLACNCDIVVPLVMARRPPHVPFVFPHFPVPADASDDELLRLWEQHYDVTTAINPRLAGPLEVGYGGTGGMLIDARVFRTLPKPWFEWRNVLGESGGEDGWFCLKARRAGFKVHCCVSMPMGHLMTCAIWPKIQEDGEIGARFTIDEKPIDVDPAPREAEPTGRDVLDV